MKLRGALLAASVVALPVAVSAQPPTGTQPGPGPVYTQPGYTQPADTGYQPGYAGQPYCAGCGYPVTGLYVGAGVGVNFLQGQNVKSFSSTQAPFHFGQLNNIQTHSQVGPVGVASVGWGFGNGLRLEGEFDYRANKFDNLTGPLNGTGGGWEQKFGPMVNLLYDFNMVPYVTPYIGAGVGYQWVNLKNTHFSGDGTLAGSSFVNDINSQTKGSFAYQAIIGAALPIAAMPGLAITAEYRFMGLASGNRNYSGNAFFSEANTFPGVHAGSVPTSVKLGSEFNHAVLVGIRYNFGVAPPPPPPVAAPAPVVQPARSYLVFFDWDKATLTDRARQIIREAAENSTRVQVTRIDVNGYTDTSGTPKYNMGLSIRRANAVKAELIRNGVPANIITAQGFGQTNLLVPTGPGVREPQNRRVEIILH